MVERIRSPGYLAHVRAQPCLICRRPGVQAHHITTAQPKARGLKTGDQWVVPLCAAHHDMLHRAGDEDRFWAMQGIAARTWAERSWKVWRHE